MKFDVTLTQNNNNNTFDNQNQSEMKNKYYRGKTEHKRRSFMIEPQTYESELKMWFLECIKSIKK